MNEFLDKAAHYWDVFYNGWLGVLPEHHRPALLVLAVMLCVLGGVVFYYKRRLRKALKGHVYLNGKIDGLKADLDRAKAANKPDQTMTEMKNLFTQVMQSAEKSNAAALQAGQQSSREANNTVASTAKEMAAKFDATVGKALEKISATQAEGNKVLQDTIRQFSELAKSNHAASMKAVGEAIAKIGSLEDDDDDDDDDEE